MRYNVLLHDRHELPVHTAVVLLRPEAQSPGLTGTYRYQVQGSACFTEFHYQLVRIWEQAPETLLEGGLGTLPLVPLCNTNEQALPPLIERMEDRLRTEGAAAQRDEIWTATYILMGLRYPREFAGHILRGVRSMKESVTYQAILEEGQARGTLGEARKLLLRLGTRRFKSEPPAPIKKAIESMADLERLEFLIERHADANGWDELLCPKP